MTVTMTDAPKLGLLVGNLGPEFDRAGEAGAGRARMTPVWPAVRKGVADGMRKALADADLLDLLAQGWAKAKALERRVADAVRDEVAAPTVTLASHDQDITLDPGFVVTINGVGAQKLPLAMVFTASIGGAILTIEGDRITEVEVGKVGLSGHVDWASIATPIEMSIPEFNLLGKHKLKQPAKIGGD